MAIIHCDMNSIKEWAKNIITMTKEDLTKATVKEDPVVTIAIVFDGTKVPKCLQVDHAHKVIAGWVFMDNLIDVSDKTAEELKMLLDPKSPIVGSKEVKLRVMLVQKSGVGKSPNSSLSASPQGIYANSSFN